MRKTSSSAILFNLAGVAVLSTVVGYALYATLKSDEAPICTGRYPPGKQLALEGEAGIPLTPIELQGRAGPREWGILKNARIAAPGIGAGAASLEVDLAPAGDDENSPRSGIGFAWPSTELANAKAVCLSYKLLLPPTFGFSRPGYLPGLYQAADPSLLDAKTPADGFSTRIGWNEGGEVGIDVRSAKTGPSWQGAESDEHWPLGRWVSVAEELRLEPAGTTLRLWVDGKLRLENALAPQPDSRPGLSGVVADIGYGDNIGALETLQLSPFVVQWQ